MNTIKYSLVIGTTREEMAPKFKPDGTIRLPEHNGYKPVVFVNGSDLFACRMFAADTYDHWYCYIKQDKWVSLGLPPWDDEILCKIRHTIDKDWVGRPCREIRGLAKELKYVDNRYEILEYL